MSKASKSTNDGKAPHLLLRERYEAGAYGVARTLALAIAADADASHEAKAEAERVLRGTVIDPHALQIGVASVALAAAVVALFLI